MFCRVFSARWVLTAAICLWGICNPLPAAERPLGTRVVAYIPDYRWAELDAEQGQYLTEAIFFSIAPEAGKPLQHPLLDDPQTSQRMQQWTRDYGVRWLVALGGWNRSQGFAAIAATPKSRREFANEAVKFCDRYGFTGVDLDWEHPETAEQEANYAELIQALKRALGTRRTVSAAVAGWQNLPAAGWKTLDAVHVMAYDGPARHSTFEAAQADVERLQQKGVPVGLIRLGVPFYGRGITERDRVLTYAQIVQQHKPEATVDEVDGVYFNGPDTIRRKLSYGRELRLGGVMVWEIGQDASGEASLLKLIDKEFRKDQ